MAKRIRTAKVREQDRIRQQRARAKMRSLIADIKKDGCIECGEKHPACLQFHHRNPENKEFTIRWAVSVKIPKNRILAEIDKCDILCANCHCKVHHEWRNA